MFFYFKKVCRGWKNVVCHWGTEIKSRSVLVMVVVPDSQGKAPLGGEFEGKGAARSLFVTTGSGVFSFLSGLWGMLAFMLIVLGVYIRKRHSSRRVIMPLVYQEISRCGLTSLPIVLFLSIVIGFLVVGQAIVLLSVMGISGYDVIADILVLVVFKEVGPLLAVLVVLIRDGVSTVVELASERASGRVEALVSLGIDPVHYYVVPRIIGMGVATLCLTIYLIASAFLSGYVTVFFTDVAWKPFEYVDQLVGALVWKDFLFLFLKTMLFGGVVAVATCYESLTRPIVPDKIPTTIIRTVIDCLVLWSLVDVIFYLF